MTEFLESPLVRGAFRTLASLLIAAAFLVVLMVASAQQQVMLSLKQTDAPKMSYSSARQMVGSVNGLREQQRATRRDIDRLQARNAKIEEQLPELEYQAQNKANQLIGINDRLARRKICNLSIVGERYNSSALWLNVYGCRTDPNMPREVVEELDHLANPETGFIRSEDRVDLLKEELTRNKGYIARNQTSIQTIAAEIAKASPVIEAFRDIDFIDENAVMRAIGLTSFPPALMQIILCFLSGLFGALLLTIILAVYPSNEFKFTQSKSYWSRILLGGLIAVGVFVVIGGGITVLGANQGLFDGEANFMSFSAIGMLAGMFSDRVAQWMSARADMFVDTSHFKADATVAAGVESPPAAAPAPPAPPAQR